MWWFRSSNVPDTEIQRRFSPEALQAVFDQNKGDVSRLEKPLAVMTQTVETSSSEVQRALLRELKLSGVVGFACTLLMVYGSYKDAAFAWSCEVLRLVHLIEENDFSDALEKIDAQQRRQERFVRHGGSHRQHQGQRKNSSSHHQDRNTNDDDDDDDNDDLSNIINNRASRMNERSSKTDSSFLSNNDSINEDENNDNDNTDGQQFSLFSATTAVNAPTIACAVVPLLRAASSRLPSAGTTTNNSNNSSANQQHEETDSNSGTTSSLLYPALALSNFATTAHNTYTQSSQQIVIKYASLITISAIFGVMPDYNADEVFSSHSTLALQVMAKLIPNILSSSDAALCAPLAASCILSSSRSQIESLLSPKYTTSSLSESTGSEIMHPATQLKLWRDANKLCLHIFKKTSTSVRPRDISRITSALEHVLRHFFAPGEDVLSRCLMSIANNNGNESTDNNNNTHNNSNIADALNNNTAVASSIDLRSSLGELICEAAEVIYCAANDGWLPISRSFFDRINDAALVSLQDPEIISRGAFGACFSCIPRVASVALRGGSIDVNHDILPRLGKLWDRIDSDLDAFVSTLNREAISSVANGLQSWVSEFYSLHPSGQASSDHWREQFEHRKIVWGLSARKHVIETRVVNTVIKLFDLTIVDVVKKRKRKSKKSNNNNTNRSKNEESSATVSDEALALWFPQLWRNGVIFALLRESKRFVKFITEGNRRRGILTFAQTIATSTCPLLLDCWHLLSNNIDPSNQCDDDDDDSSSSADDDDNDYNHHQSQNISSKPESNKKYNKKLLDLDEIRRLHVPLKQSRYPDLLRRLYDRCRFVRRDHAPPEFVLRTLQLLIASPCPICNVGLIVAKSSSSSTALTAIQQQKSTRCSNNNQIAKPLQKKSKKKKGLPIGGTIYQQNPFLKNQDDQDTSDIDDGGASSSVNSMMIASPLSAMEASEIAAAAGGDELETATVASIDSICATPAFRNQHHLDPNSQSSPFDSSAGGDDSEGNNNSNNNNRELLNSAFIKNAGHRQILHIANLVLPHEFSSVRTVHVLVGLLDEATLRYTNHKKFLDQWDFIVRVCIECLNRPELRGIPRNIQHRLFNDQLKQHEQQLMKSGKYTDKMEDGFTSSSTLAVKNNNISVDDDSDSYQALFQQDVAIFEQHLRQSFLTPLDRIRPRDLFLMAQLFTRGKGWIQNDQTIAPLRDIFDEERVRYLHEERNEIWARCLLGVNPAIVYEVTVAASSSATGSDDGAEKQQQKTDSTDGTHDNKNIGTDVAEGDSSSSKVESMLRPLPTASDSVIKVQLHARFVAWVLQRRFFISYHHGKSSSNNKVMRRAAQDVSYLILRFLYSVENYPRDFDAFARAVLLLEK